jgi:hypothetical protein
MTMLSGLPGNFGPYSPSPRGGGASTIGMTRRASAACSLSRTTDAPATQATVPVKPPAIRPASLSRCLSTSVMVTVLLCEIWPLL